VLFELAKLAESEEKTDDAVKRYKQLIQEFPLSPFSTEANLRVTVLAPEETQEPEESTASTNSEIDEEKLESQKEENEEKALSKESE
jgi:acetyl/propionyl-CoA carboxylase alpha subunit